MSKPAHNKELSNKIQELSYKDLLQRKTEVQSRISELTQTLTLRNTKSKEDKQQNKQNELVSVVVHQKTDTHWDFLLKEMMWLSEDFMAERGRQMGNAKKLSMAVRQYHKTLHTRKQREAAERLQKRKRLAAKIARDVKGWWGKIERVVAYKQKLETDERKQKAMDKHLVFLVKQTEKYSDSLSYSTTTKQSIGGSKKNNTCISQMKIEEALALSEKEEGSCMNSIRSRRQRARLMSTNYANAHQIMANEDDFYGESTASDGTATDNDDDDDDVYEPTIHSDGSEAASGVDDETTICEAEEYAKAHAKSNEQSEIEIELLEREADLSLEEVLQRYRDEAEAEAEKNVHNNVNIHTNLHCEDEALSDGDANRASSQRVSSSTTRRSVRRVTFAAQQQSQSEQQIVNNEANASASASVRSRRRSSTRQQRQRQRQRQVSTMTTDRAAIVSDTGNDADDDADASDVEDFIVENDDDGTTDHAAAGAAGEDEDFSIGQDDDEMDDETTIAAEERLGRDMSHEEEIELLKAEGEMSVEELRAKYAVLLDTCNANGGGIDDNGNDNDSIMSTSSIESSAASEEYIGNNDEVDDETTLIAEEKMGREISHEEEMQLLQEENEIPIEQLRAMYASINGPISSQQEQTESASIVEDSVDDDVVDVEGHNVQSSPLSSGSEDFIGADEVDDETTLIAEEKFGRDISYEDELALLKKENEMSVEDLRKMYMYADIENGGYNDSDRESSSSVSSSRHLNSVKSIGGQHSALDNDNFPDEGDNDAHDEEYQPTGAMEVDDERTLEEEERMGRDMGYDEEIAMLKRENEMSVDELRAMYFSMETKESVSNGGVYEEGKNGNSLKRRRTSRLSNEKESERELDRDRDSNITSQQRKRPLSCHAEESKSDETIGDADSALLSLQLSDAKARQTAASRPFILSSWVSLRAYQQIGLNWLVSLQTRRLNGILADEMGLGKTLQTISLLAYLASYKGIWGPHLIIVPTSCMVNWEMELKRFCPGFKVLCYYGSAKRRKELRTGWTKANWHHVVITSYQLVVQDSFAFKRKKWYYMILDEAQNIKNFQSQRWQTLINFNTQRRLLLTGTPLQNDLMELWSLLHFLMPHVFRSRKEFSYWFSNPMNSIVEGTANRNDDLIGRLHGIIRPFVLRRLKKDVEQQMPGKFEHIVKCNLSRRQMFLYEEFMARSSTRTALTKGGNFMAMMNVLMQLRKVCNHPDLFEPRSIVTPFTMEPLNFRTAACVTNATEYPPLQEISRSLICPIWSAGVGLPTIEATYHDEILSSQLTQLQVPSRKLLDVDDKCMMEPKPDKDDNPGLASILATIWDNEKAELVSRAHLQGSINATRCQSPAFPYSIRLQKAIEMDSLPLERLEFEEAPSADIARTPKELLLMRRSQQQRAEDFDEIIKRFVFCVPSANSKKPELISCRVIHDAVLRESRLSRELSRPIEEYFRPYLRSNARLTSFFPDKKLIQFDAGKLQTLARLLRNLKQDGHRVLIFTQMSKMLDILESFLNINGHTYLRLDGSTGVDRRQRLMDRFNTDTKIFSFILSTRSGGLGINLTGADTVIFYDSDWNPAMDAQAQDRAHRIGQTRDVHIYRLVTEHSIEENILIKAKQKQHLDFLVMNEGKFDASVLSSEKHDDKSNSEVFTKGGLREILVREYDKLEPSDNEDGNDNGNREEKEINSADIENVMASLEDADDVQAMRGAQKEAQDELVEFDENVQFKADEESSQADDSVIENESQSSAPSLKKKGKIVSKKSSISGSDDSAEISKQQEEKDLEKEFAAWQNSIGVDVETIRASLGPAERYALNFREAVDPYYSLYFLTETEKMNQSELTDQEWDIDAIEDAKIEEERQAMDDGDLLATDPHPMTLYKQRHLYRREKIRLKAAKKRRKLTGEDWVLKNEPTLPFSFWYNEDTGEVLLDKPRLIQDLEAEVSAREKKWNALPLTALVRIMCYLTPHPERMTCSVVCRQWSLAGRHASFVLHVLPVEMGAMLESTKLDHNHYRSIDDALATALPGDTIELGDGHYWVNKGMEVHKPLRIVGDENDPSNVVLELTGTINWAGRGGWMEGVTVRRPRASGTDEGNNIILRIKGGGRFDMGYCILNNEGNNDSVVELINDAKGQWHDVIIKGAGVDSAGLLAVDQSRIEIVKGEIRNNQGPGILLKHGEPQVTLKNCRVEHNAGGGIILDDERSRLDMFDTIVSNNQCGNVIKRNDRCVITNGTCDAATLLCNLPTEAGTSQNTH